MSERIWDKYLSERDKQVLAEGGFWQRAGFGHRPALLVIDVNYNFVGDKPEPILESIKRWPFSCGEEGWAGVAVIQRLIAATRAKRLPIIYTTGEYRADVFDYGGSLRKQSRLTENVEQLIEGDEILAEIAPEPQDIVIKKQKASAFNSTPLVSYLIDLKIDTLPHHRHDDGRLRLRQRDRCGEPQLSLHRRGGCLFRPRRSFARHGALRYEFALRRRHPKRRGAALHRNAAGWAVRAADRRGRQSVRAARARLNARPCTLRDIRRARRCFPCRGAKRGARSWR